MGGELLLVGIISGFSTGQMFQSNYCKFLKQNVWWTASNYYNLNYQMNTITTIDLNMDDQKI